MVSILLSASVRPVVGPTIEMRVNCTHRMDEQLPVRAEREIGLTVGKYPLVFIISSQATLYSFRLKGFIKKIVHLCSRTTLKTVNKALD
jgi:hypothetical protein